MIGTKGIFVYDNIPAIQYMKLKCNVLVTLLKSDAGHTSQRSLFFSNILFSCL